MWRSNQCKFQSNDQSSCGAVRSFAYLYRANRSAKVNPALQHPLRRSNQRGKRFYGAALPSLAMDSPMSYIGGKRRLAKRIVALFPPHVTYCEVFLGGGQVFFRKEPSKVEVLNDL